MIFYIEFILIKRSKYNSVFLCGFFVQFCVIKNYNTENLRGFTELHRENLTFDLHY